MPHVLVAGRIHEAGLDVLRRAANLSFEVVDEEVLAEALEKGRLAGAGLDVFAQEPPAADARLLRSDRVILTPHSAGLTEECAARTGQVAAQNIVDFFDGRLDPRLVVNRRA